MVPNAIPNQAEYRTTDSSGLRPCPRNGRKATHAISKNNPWPCRIRPTRGQRGHPAGGSEVRSKTQQQPELAADRSGLASLIDPGSRARSSHHPLRSSLLSAHRARRARPRRQRARAPSQRTPRPGHHGPATRGRVRGCWQRMERCSRCRSSQQQRQQQRQM